MKIEHKKLKLIILTTIIMLACFGFGKEVLATTYYATGTLTSTNLLSGESVESIDSFYTSSTIATGTSLWVQFSTSSTSGPWYDASSTSGTTTVPNGTSTITLSGSLCSGDKFYYKMQFNSNAGATSTPVLDEIKVNYTSSQSPFVIDQSGKIGIGTTSPSTKLTVTGNITSQTILPQTTNTYNLGSLSYKWANLYAATTTVGDIVFANEFRITEAPTSTFPALYFQNQFEENLITIDENGFVSIGSSVTVGSLAGTGNAYVFADEEGQLYRGAGADFAEYFPVKEGVEEGDVVVIAKDDDTQIILEKSNRPYDEKLVGVISPQGTPAIGPIPEGENYLPVAMAGRLPVKVSTENGAIEIGNPLTSSLSMPGATMKATRPGQIIGYALEPFGLHNSTSTTSTATSTATTTEAATTTPKILVFINPGFSLGTLDENGNLSLLKSDFNTTSSSTSTSATSTETTILSRFTQAVRNALAKLGLVVENGIAKVKKLVAGIVRVDKLEMVDQTTGEVYCIWFENGQQLKAPGACDQVDYSQAQPLAGSSGSGGVGTSTDSGVGGTSTQIFYYDGDGDGYGGPGSYNVGIQPEGYVANEDDCNDFDASINPGALEVCDDGINNNCNGQVDENCAVATTTEATTTEATTTEATTTEATTTEATTTEPVCQPQTFYLDSDSDSYGDPLSATSSCEQPVGYVTDSSDCNDQDPNIHPQATETCDGIDNNCDGQIDENCDKSDLSQNQATSTATTTSQ